MIDTPEIQNSCHIHTRAHFFFGFFSCSRSLAYFPFLFCFVKLVVSFGAFDNTIFHVLWTRSNSMQCTHFDRYGLIHTTPLSWVTWTDSLFLNIFFFLPLIQQSRAVLRIRALPLFKKKLGTMSVFIYLFEWVLFERVTIYIWQKKIVAFCVCG